MFRRGQNNKFKPVMKSGGSDFSRDTTLGGGWRVLPGDRSSIRDCSLTVFLLCTSCWTVCRDDGELIRGGEEDGWWFVFNTSKILGLGSRVKWIVIPDTAQKLYSRCIFRHPSCLSRNYINRGFVLDMFLSRLAQPKSISQHISHGWGKFFLFLRCFVYGVYWGTARLENGLLPV